MMKGGPEEEMSASDRAMWGQMRMDPADIADVTAATYTYLVHGHGPQENWTGLFHPGERVRLRIINPATLTIFNVRIPGLPITEASSDGLNVRPALVEHCLNRNYLNYDVLIQPTSSDEPRIRHKLVSTIITLWHA